MTVLPLSPTLGLHRSVAESRQLLTELQQQLASGKKVQTYGDLGGDRNGVLAFRAELTQIVGYQNTIKFADVQLDVMLLSMERLRDLASESKSDALEVGFEVQSSGQTAYQTELAGRFDEVVALLNSSVGDRHLFGGRQIENPPVVPAGEILNGAGSRAGFKQIAAERRQADLGADGRGRTILSGPEARALGGPVADPGDLGGAAPAQVTIDIGGNAQNFDISDGGLDTLAALEAAIDAAFGADVASIVGGNQLRLTAPNVTDSISITDVDAGAAALAGLTSGTVANPTATATIAEDAAGSPFGFKLASGATSSAGIAVTGPGGVPPAIGVTFNGAPVNNGETVRVTLDLPDGTQTDVTLIARTAGPVSAGEFLVDADPNLTAVNFQTALTASMEAEAQRSLSAASLFESADNFFDFDGANPPRRVAGPPFDTATALVDATPTDTVLWYQGEVSSTPARNSALAKADDSIVTPYGARANEDAMRTVLKNLAAMAVETFDPNDGDAAQRYAEMKSRVSDGLAFTGNEQSVEDVITELVIAKTTIGRASERHDSAKAVLDGFVGDAENADLYEVSAAILTLQGRIEASLAVTASLSNLSILNFI